MNPQAQRTLLLEMGDRVLQSWWTVVAGLCCGLAVGFAALQQMPKVYQATTRIWVSQQQIPEDVVRTTVTDDITKRLVAFRDAVLEQDYMIELIRRTFGLPESEAELNALIGRVKGNVTVTEASRRGAGLLAFGLSYRDTDPQRAAQVANTLTTLYINQNSEFRKAQAERTAETIEQMAAKAKEEFDRIDEKLTQFIQKHQFETEAHLGANLQLLDSRKRDLEILGDKRETARDQLEQLEEQFAQVQEQLPTSDSLPTTGVIIDPLTRRIAQLQSELEELRVHYSEQHPDLIKKKRELEEALALAHSRRPSMPGEPDELPEDPAALALVEQINELKRELSTFDVEERKIRRDIAEYERRIEVEPEVQRQLNELMEEHAVLREDYRRLQRNAERSKESIDLERSGMGEQMEVLEYAGVPGQPVEPDPRRIYLVCLAFGGLLFVGPMLARHALNPPVASESGLRSLTDLPVLVSIPRIMTQENRNIPRRRLFKNVGFSMLAGIGLMVVRLVLG